MQAVERALADGGVQAAQVSFVVHATTVATNAIIEGTIARSGFVTTDGFRDLLEIARQVRPTLYDTQFEKAAAARAARPRGRACASGSGRRARCCSPLDDDSVREAAAILRREEVESVAVCLLHSYVNPEHEQRVGAILAEELPGVPVSLSAEVAPEFREYLRASTTVINAVIRPVVRALPRADRGPARRRRHRGEAPRHAVERRRLRLGRRGGEAGVHGRVGARRRRDRGRVSRRDARPPGHPLVRHGRHDREGRPDPGRPPVGDEGLQRRRPCGRRHRRPVALGLPGADAGRRPRRDRRGRRLDRVGRLGRPAARRPAQRGRRPRPGLLPARRHGADRHRRERRARTAQPRLLPRRRDGPRRRGRARARSRSGARSRSAST